METIPYQAVNSVKYAVIISIYGLTLIKLLQITGQSLLSGHNWLASCQYHLDSSIIEKADRKNSKDNFNNALEYKILDSININHNQGKSLDKNLIPQLQGLTKQPMKINKL